MYKSIPNFLFFALCAWTLYYIVSYDDYYYGEPLTKLNVVVDVKPEYYFDGETKISFYAFTVQNYKNEFRISQGAVNLVRDSDSLTKKVEQIQEGDSICIDVMNSEMERLKTGKNIRVIGLTVNNEWLIKPGEVEKTNRHDKADRWFGYLVVALIIIFMVRANIKRRKRTMAD